MSKYISGVIIGLLVFVTVRVIAGALNLNERALRLGYWLPQIPREYRWLITWAGCAPVGIAALALWLAFNVDQRIRNWWAAVPPIASLQIGSAPVMTVEKSGPDSIRSVELAVPLQNTNERLLRFDADLRATANGKDLDKPVVFSGYVNAHGTATLLVTIKDVPMKKEDNVMHLMGAMRYDVRYRFDGENGTRRTSKLVKWESTAPAQRQPGSELKLDMFVRFSDEIEE